MKKQKVLIIKVGYSETLDPEIGNTTSYGDVLRSTVLLNLYKDDHVTWLVDEKAYPIVKNNPYIDRFLIYNLTSVLQLQAEHFDTVINLEKVPGLCALADSITAWRRCGFRFDVKSGEAEAYDGTHNAISLIHDQERKKSHSRLWQEYLFEMVGGIWNNEEYVLGYSPQPGEKYDIGLNFEVGSKWPSKAWPREYWDRLAALLNKKYSVSWQQGLKNMEEYFQWINNCRTIITNDSFGLHLALVFKKQVVALFGPTNSREVYFYGRGVGLTADKSVCPYYPCYLPQCKIEDKECLKAILPEDVYHAVLSLESKVKDRQLNEQLTS